jgi:hypothetical protein
MNAEGKITETVNILDVKKMWVSRKDRTTREFSELGVTKEIMSDVHDITSKKIDDEKICTTVLYWNDHLLIKKKHHTKQTHFSLLQMLVFWNFCELSRDGELDK